MLTVTAETLTLDLTATMAHFMDFTTQAPPIAKKVASVEASVRNADRKALARLLKAHSREIQRLALGLPVGPLHLMLPTTPESAAFISLISQSRRVLVEDTFTMRSVLDLGAPLAHDAFRKMTHLLADVKNGTADVVVTFPDTRLVDPQMSLGADFMGKKRHYGYEDALPAHYGIANVAVLCCEGERGLRLRDVALQKGSQFRELAEFLTQCFAEAMNGFATYRPMSILSWRNALASTPEGLRFALSVRSRVGEALLNKAMQHLPGMRKELHSALRQYREHLASIKI